MTKLVQSEELASDKQELCAVNGSFDPDFALNHAHPHPLLTTRLSASLLWFLHDFPLCCSLAASLWAHWKTAETPQL